MGEQLSNFNAPMVPFPNLSLPTHQAYLQETHVPKRYLAIIFVPYNLCSLLKDLSMASHTLPGKREFSPSQKGARHCRVAESKPSVPKQQSFECPAQKPHVGAISVSHLLYAGQLPPTLLSLLTLCVHPRSSIRNPKHPMKTVLF